VSFPEKVLADDETVVEHLHPHWITLVPATFWFLVICAGGGFAIAFLPSGGTTHLVLLILVIVVGLILLSWLAFAPWISWRTTHFVFTTHRVLIRRGVLHHIGRDIALQRISDVGYSQTLWDRIVGAGTLSIESAGEHGQERSGIVEDDAARRPHPAVAQPADRAGRRTARAPGLGRRPADDLRKPAAARLSAARLSAATGLPGDPALSGDPALPAAVPATAVI
jgi:uncharacterized membrane protein YdbT with pleckstrin-like domain